MSRTLLELEGDVQHLLDTCVPVVELEDLRANVVAIADEMVTYANLFDSRMDIVRAWAERLKKL